MDLSFDKLKEQFDLRRNEHQRNMNKINKRIDEIESHMDSIKKQLHQFDHQIEHIEKDLKTTLSMINQENMAHQHHSDSHHLEHHNQNHQHKKNWAENILNNVEEFSATIFEKINDEDQNKNHQNKNEQNNNHRVSTSSSKPSASIDNQSLVSQVNESLTNATVEKYVPNTNENISSNQSYLNQADLNFNNVSTNQLQNKNQQQTEMYNNIEKTYEDLAIDEWEDKTTNLSMTEWFEVDPRGDR